MPYYGGTMGMDEYPHPPMPGGGAPQPPQPPGPAAPAPPAPPAPTGVPQTFDALKQQVAQHGGISGEGGAHSTGGDWRQAYGRFSQSDFDRWKEYLDPGCPPGKPFKSSRAGVQGCFEKPTECPPGSHPGGGKETDPCVPRGQGAGGRAAGARGAGGFQPAGMAGASDTIWQAIQGRLKGESRFSPEAMDTLLGSIRSQAEGAAGRASAEAEADMARRRLSRSSIAERGQREIRTGMYGQVLQASANLQRAKIDADFMDKTQAINDGMNWLNSLRSYVASMTATQAQKDVAMANIQLGYKQLQHQTDLMRESYAQDMAKLGLTM